MLFSGILQWLPEVLLGRKAPFLLKTWSFGRVSDVSSEQHHLCVEQFQEALATCAEACVFLPYFPYHDGHPCPSGAVCTA